MMYNSMPRSPVMLHRGPLVEPRAASRFGPVSAASRERENRGAEGHSPGIHE